MRKVPLSKSNPYLREAVDLKALLLNSIATSTAIEGVHGVLPKAYKPSRKKNGGLYRTRTRSVLPITSLNTSFIGS